ncbi:MAG: LuxR family transcriptional regulator [Rhodospirillales bacterium]|nr:LuxR family transcriptional regulator [Rhodospirillales bacterium]
MHRIFQTFIDGLLEGNDESGLSAAMSRAASALELSCFAYLCLPHRKNDQARLISTYPLPWTSHYLSNHYERLDPVIRQALQVTEPFEWGHRTEPGYLSDAQQQLFEEAATFGIRYGFTIPIHDGRGPVAAVTFASNEQSSTFRRCVEAHRRVLQLMALYFHASARRKLQSDRIVDGVALSPREYECLEWSATGKSASDIGGILGITRRTAAFHLDNARAKLGVRQARPGNPDAVHRPRAAGRRSWRPPAGRP